MRFKRRTKIIKGELGTIDIAPLIDIVFQMLIFFMLTSAFILQPGIRVNLPRALTSEAVDGKNLVITITGENVIYIQDRVVTTSELRSELRTASAKNLPVLIKSDETVSIGRIVEVWDMCRQENITHLNIATQQQ
jgi:biopolymer transport protein ExbD